MARGIYERTVKHSQAIREGMLKRQLKHSAETRKKIGEGVSRAARGSKTLSAPRTTDKK